MSIVVSAEVKDRMGQLRQGGQRMVPAAELAAIVEDVLASLGGDLTKTDLRLFQELESLSRFIQNARSEIAAVRPDHIRERDIPKATDELDAVVGATEHATGTILDACEALEKASSGAAPEVAEAITEQVTRIYEACNFQDITGQRITKVVRTLKQIEERVAELLGAFGPDLGPLPDEAPAAAAAQDDKSLLHGPQMPEEAKRQAEIDAILASFG
jgi:chemotaxis protein CheZ